MTSKSSSRGVGFLDLVFGEVFEEVVFGESVFGVTAFKEGVVELGVEVVANLWASSLAASASSLETNSDRFKPQDSNKSKRSTK